MLSIGQGKNGATCASLLQHRSKLGIRYVPWGQFASRICSEMGNMYFVREKFCLKEGYYLDAGSSTQTHC